MFPPSSNAFLFCSLVTLITSMLSILKSSHITLYIQYDCIIHLSLVHENGGYWYVLAGKGVFWRAPAGFDGQWRIWAESTQ